MMNKLYIPSNFKPEWITNFIHDENDEGICVVSDIDASNVEEIGCDQLDCHICICYSKNLCDIGDVTILEVWDVG